VAKKLFGVTDPSPTDGPIKNESGAPQPKATDNPGVYGGWDESDLPPFVCSEEEVPPPKRKPGGR
jgi:hypothetical protein